MTAKGASWARKCQNYYPGEPVNIHIQIINKYYPEEKLVNYHQKRVRLNTLILW